MSTTGENNANTATNNQGTTSTSNAQTDGNAQTTTTDGNTQATSSPEATSAASYNNQNTNGGSTANTDNGGQSNGNGSQGGGGLGIPVIVGIVVGSVAVVLMVAAFIIWYRRTKRSPRSPRYDTTNNYTGTTTGSSRKEYGDRVYSHAIPVAVPISGDEYFEEITSTEILGRRSEMEGDAMSGSWNDPEILDARIPIENLRVQQLLNPAEAFERLQSIARETLTISSRGEEEEFAL
ncbi:hypothetical protein PHYPSEUDO_005021 [Phytophthora pseudosyringae]|uniref:Uncharacterized protein n=1 Tax=Phytophthora pseudosyringae TaxID=221518 RepID=A0A8T1VQN2_9STRA|nr:hypothetical protein PHYPSEUDO_005021 [Phytophthora pseudosyringae]